MQIIELYIRDGVFIQPSAATSTSTNNLIDANASFTSTVEVGYIVFNLKNGTSAKVTAITNDTTLVLSESTDGSNFFTVGEQYIIKSDFKRLDLFEDESVSITDSIKNVKDVAKIFTPFSQQFNVPASKHNSKIFRHYEDQDIINSFDARYKVDALIKLNGTDYKKGKIKLSSVSLKNNKPHAYKLIFFGETIELKDILGEGMLSDLTFPDSLNFPYNHTTVLDKFQNLSDVCFPLITHTKNMRYDTNVYRSTTPVSGEKLNYRDIKPAIKVRKIIDAIETTYPDIDFTGEFFNTEDFNRLYLWMHREKGFMSNAPEGGGLNVLRAHFHQVDDTDANLSLQSGEERRPLFGQSPDFVMGLGGASTSLTFNITTATADTTFNLRVYRSSVTSTIGGYTFSIPETNVFNQEFTGSTSYSPFVFFGSNSAVVDVFIEVTSTNSFNIQSFEIVATKTSSTGTTSGTYDVDSLSVANTVEINRQMPKIKTFDFITNLFKMFNLVAYKENTQIRVLPLNDFYREGVSYDITKYVDTTKNSISKVLQFKNFNFNFKSKKSFLVEKSDELQADNFGGSSFGLPQGDGGDYNIELDFEKMMFERLSDENNNALTTIGQGAMLDKDFNPTIGKPLLLYITNLVSSTTFAFANADGGSDVNISEYNRPSQVRVSSGAVGDASAALNFGLEQDEFFLEPKGTNLLEKYYLDYVSSVFHPQARINKVDAFLPLHIILNYQLNDTFIIGNKPYRINNIKTNLLTNKSSLELYSLSQSITGIENDQTASLGRLASLNVTVKGSDFITIEWTALPNPVANNITGYDLYVDDTFSQTLPNTTVSKKVTGLQSEITYKFAIRVRYTIGGVVSFSNDTIAYGTTLPAPTALAENGDTLITEQSDTIILE